MAGNQEAVRRYVVILRNLRRGGKHRSKDLYQACINSGINVEYRTVQNDLQNLKNNPQRIFGKDLGIKVDSKTKKWYSDNIPEDIISMLELEEGEIDALLFYAKIIRQYRDYPIFKQISDAIKKVFESSNISNQTSELFEKETLIESEKHPSIKGTELIPDILEALQEHKIIIAEYQKFNGSRKKKHYLKPILLKEDKQMWYIIGYSDKKKSIITLALDRINTLHVTEDNFTPIEFDSEEHFKFNFGITMSNEEPIDVEISFTPDQGNYLRTLPIHSSQQIILDNQEEFRIRVKVRPTYEFYSKIKSYAEQARVISPPQVVEEIKDSFNKALEAYK